MSLIIGKGVNLECVEKLAWDLLGLLGLKGPTARDVLAKRPAHKAVESAGNLLCGSRDARLAPSLSAVPRSRIPHSPVQDSAVFGVRQHAAVPLCPPTRGGGFGPPSPGVQRPLPKPRHTAPLAPHVLRAMLPPPA